MNQRGQPADLMLPIIAIVVIGGIGAAVYYFYYLKPDKTITSTAKAKPTPKGASYPKCSSPIKPGAKFCSVCGGKIK